MVGKHFVLGFIACLFFLACTGATFKYYGLTGADYNTGTLRGPKASDDIPFSKCAPIGNEQYPCVILFTNDFFALKQDYLDAKQKLKECEKRNR